MDELTEGLAPLFIDIVLDVIRDLKSAGQLGILIVVQELPIALQLPITSVFWTRAISSSTAAHRS